MSTTKGTRSSNLTNFLVRTQTSYTTGGKGGKNNLISPLGGGARKKNQNQESALCKKGEKRPLSIFQRKWTDGRAVGEKMWMGSGGGGGEIRGGISKQGNA